MNTIASSAIFDTNPYESHPSLSPLESDVLWEYAKLSQHIKEVRRRSNAICFAYLAKPRSLTDRTPTS